MNSGSFPVKGLSDAQLKHEILNHKSTYRSYINLFNFFSETDNVNLLKKSCGKYRIRRDFMLSSSCGIGPVTPLLSMYLEEGKCLRIIFHI